MRNKKRYSVPAKLIELLWTDDEFFRDVSNIKKAAMNSAFPKNDQYADHDGFHLEFALAGYAPGDIEVVAIGSILNVSGNGLEDSSKVVGRTKFKPLNTDLGEELLEEYVKDTKPALHHGNIIRGIARRSFNVKFIISEEFDLSKASATMENGLLHVIIPGCKIAIPQNIKINNAEE